MTDVPSIGQEVDIDGQKWRRIAAIPNAASSTGGDPYSAKDFNTKMGGKNVTVGDLWDASKEASDKRAAKEGKDPIKEKYYRDYARERKGVLHHGERKEKTDRQMSEVKTQIKKALET